MQFCRLLETKIRKRIKITYQPMEGDNELMEIGNKNSSQNKKTKTCTKIKMCCMQLKFMLQNFCRSRSNVRNRELVEG